MTSQEPEIKDKSAPLSKFKWRQKVETPVSESEMISYMKKKRFVPVVIEIRIDAPLETSILHDRFTLWIDSTKIRDNTTIMQKRMSVFSNEISKLVERWTSELKG